MRWGAAVCCAACSCRAVLVPAARVTYRRHLVLECARPCKLSPLKFYCCCTCLLRSATLNHETGRKLLGKRSLPLYYGDIENSKCYHNIHSIKRSINFIMIYFLCFLCVIELFVLETRALFTTLSTVPVPYVYLSCHNNNRAAI